MDTFKERLPIGIAGEELTEYYLRDVLKKEVLKGGGFDRSRDLTVNGVEVEVKTDVKARKTGNVCIEHRSLETHTAPFLIYLLPEFYIVKRSALQDLISYWPDKVQIGDDKRAGTLLKINTDTFAEIFKKL